MKTRTKVGLWFGLVIAIIAAIIGVICIRTQNKRSEEHTSELQSH